MFFVTARPESLVAAGSDLAAIGSTMNAQSAVAAAPTTGVVPAASEEVSALTAAAFAAQARLYQLVSAQAEAVHQMFVTTLNSNGGWYAATEAGNAAAIG